MAFRVLKSSKDDHIINDFIRAYFITIGVAVIGGIILIFFAMLKMRRLRNSFVYNLFGTFNMIIGVLGLVLFFPGTGPYPYITTACLGIGIVIYMDIYRQ